MDDDDYTVNGKGAISQTASDYTVCKHETKNQDNFLVNFRYKNVRILLIYTGVHQSGQ